MRPLGFIGLHSIKNFPPGEPITLASGTSCLGAVSTPMQRAISKGSYGGPFIPRAEASRTTLFTWSIISVTGSGPAESALTDLFVHRTLEVSIYCPLLS